MLQFRPVPNPVLIHPTQRAENGCKCMFLKGQSRRGRNRGAPRMIATPTPTKTHTLTVLFLFYFFSKKSKAHQSDHAFDCSTIRQRHNRCNIRQDISNEGLLFIRISFKSVVTYFLLKDLRDEVEFRMFCWHFRRLHEVHKHCLCLPPLATRGRLRANPLYFIFQNMTNRTKQNKKRRWKKWNINQITFGV